MRVRQALELGLDFEWMNREFFYNSYTRVRGYFNASDFEAKGLPGPDELAVLEPLGPSCRRRCSPSRYRSPLHRPARQPAGQPAPGPAPA